MTLIMSDDTVDLIHKQMLNLISTNQLTYSELGAVNAPEKVPALDCLLVEIQFLPVSTSWLILISHVNTENNQSDHNRHFGKSQIRLLDYWEYLSEANVRHTWHERVANNFFFSERKTSSYHNDCVKTSQHLIVVKYKIRNLCDVKMCGADK